MGIVATLLKNGPEVLAGFLLGLGAIAVIRPETANGRILLLITVIVLVVVVGQILRFVLRRLSAKEAAKPRDGDTPSG